MEYKTKYYLLLDEKQWKHLSAVVEYIPSHATFLPIVGDILRLKAREGDEQSYEVVDREIALGTEKSAIFTFFVKEVDTLYPHIT